MVVIACFAAVAFPRYFWEKEKARALATDAILADAEIAQDSFMRINGQFAADWTELSRYFSVPAILNVTTRAWKEHPRNYIWLLWAPTASRRRTDTSCGWSMAFQSRSRQFFPPGALAGVLITGCLGRYYPGKRYARGRMKKAKNFVLC